MRELFDVQVGLSDHTLGTGVSVASVALGATVIEKHFTLSRKDGGVDSKFSLEPDEFNNLVEESKRAWQSLGQITYGGSQKEEKSKTFRRSLYIVEDVKEGELFTPKNLRAIRPGLGLEPKYFDMLIGKTAKCNIKRGSAFKWKFL